MAEICQICRWFFGKFKDILKLTDFRQVYFIGLFHYQKAIDNFNHLIIRTMTHRTLTKVLQNVLVLG